MTHEPLHHVGLYPDGFSRGPNVFQQVIDCMTRTHETLHPGKLFLDQYEITLARPIHTHNNDPDLTNLLDVWTYDDVHNGMVVDSGPSVAENCNSHLFRHFPHLTHVPSTL